MSYIAAGNTTTTALTTYADTTGNLVFTTGGANTTALTLSNTQAATFANNVTITGTSTHTGNASFSNITASGTVTATGGFVVGASAAPAFSAYLSSTQSITSGTNVKVQCNTEEFDTNSNYDNATNYRFTPTVAGYYQVNARTDNGSSTNGSQCTAIIYKNGSQFKLGVQFSLTSAQYAEGASVSCLIYCNGSTDYIEFYVNVTASSAAISSGASTTYFQACFVRSA
jgi:hypothetical protein